MWKAVKNPLIVSAETVPAESLDSKNKSFAYISIAWQSGPK